MEASLVQDGGEDAPDDEQEHEGGAPEAKQPYRSRRTVTSATCPRPHPNKVTPIANAAMMPAPPTTCATPHGSTGPYRDDPNDQAAKRGEDS